jgi:hypothetical protein
MKKIVLLGIAIVTVFSSNLKAQIEEAGNNYVKLQFVQPLGEYKDYYNSGFGAEFGRMFPLNFDIADGLILPGLDITFLSTSFNTGKDHTYFTAHNYTGTDYEFISQGGLVWDLGVKLGPMITVGITDGLVADFSIQYDPTLVFNISRKGASENAWNRGDGRFDKKSSSAVSFAHMLGIKADIRYSHFIFGLEFKLGSTAFHYSNNIVPYEDGIIQEVDLNGDGVKETATNVRFDDEKDMGLGTLLLNFGYTF